MLRLKWTKKLKWTRKVEVDNEVQVDDEVNASEDSKDSDHELDWTTVVPKEKTKPYVNEFDHWDDSD